MKKHSPRIILLATLVVMLLVAIAGFANESVEFHPVYPYVTFFLLLVASPAAVLYLVHSEVK